MLFDVEDDVEANTIHQPERRDARRGEDLPHAVDVLQRRDAFLDQARLIRLDIAWGNRNAHKTSVPKVVDGANVA